MAGGHCRASQYAKKEDWRVIDNGKAAGHNKAVDMSERIHTSCIEQGLAIAASLRHHCVSNGWNPLQQRATRDMKRAYRQIPVCREHARWQVVCLWTPSERRWVFSELKGLAFGLAVAVLHFNRVSAQLTAIARRWLESRP